MTLSINLLTWIIIDWSLHFSEHDHLLRSNGNTNGRFGERKDREEEQQKTSATVLPGVATSTDTTWAFLPIR